MPWNRTTRKDYKRDGRRYESDVTGQEWAMVEARLPTAAIIDSQSVKTTESGEPRGEQPC